MSSGPGRGLSRCAHEHSARPDHLAARTDRLTLRPTTPDDLEATWQFRRLENVSRWLTRAPATLEEYRPPFEDADSLAKSLVIQLDNEVIGDLVLQVDDALIVQ
jgi:hypothetical protein